MGKYNLTIEQEAIVSKIYSLMEEAKAQGVGFIFDKTTLKMSSVNAAEIESIEVEEFSDNCNLNDSNMCECSTEFLTDYYHDGQFLVAK